MLAMCHGRHRIIHKAHRQQVMKGAVASQIVKDTHIIAIWRPVGDPVVQCLRQRYGSKPPIKAQNHAVKVQSLPGA